MTYGYIRVSSADQNEDRQIDALNACGIEIDRIYAEKASGKDFTRPEWQSLVSQLREGDLLVIKSIDRMGRNYEGIIAAWQHITKELGADIYVLDMPLLDTRRNKDLVGTLISDIVLQLLSYVAQNEREMNHQRQAEGYAAAKARGVKFGRPTLEIDLTEAKARVERGEISVRAVCRELGISKNSWYRKVGAV